MKKSTIKTVIACLNGENVNVAELLATLQGELDRLNEKARANAELYASAKDIVLSALTSEPMTVTEIYNLVGGDLPETFSKSKVQYALLNYWADEVVKTEVPHGANKYSRKE